jgi:hypothetical protein
MVENAPVATVGMTTDRRTVSDSREGRRRAEKRRRPVRRSLLAALVAGALACGVAWFFLVRAAIDFGRLARDGQGLAWAFTAAATIGATACLLLMFILVTRVLVTVGLVGSHRPRRAAARRRKG